MPKAATKSVPASKPQPYLEVRLTSVRAALGEYKIDALLLTHPGDLAYLSDFSGEDSVGVLTQDSFTLVTDFRYTEQAAIECPWLGVKLREGKMSEALCEVLRSLKAKRVGFESGFTTYATVHTLIAALDEAATKAREKFRPAFVPLDNVMVGLRKIKDAHEIAILRQSVKVAEAAFTTLKSLIRPGQTENHLAGQLVFELRSRGASDSSFPVIIAAGANSSLPHYRPQNVKVANNSPLLIDWGALYNGYCSDLTRTLAVGKAAAKFKEIYGIVLEAQLAALDFLRPGVTTFDADAVARDHITQAGYGEQFGHSLGHGIGRDIHEQPSLRKTGTSEPLEAGMVVTVEPGIYLPGVGGVRIEDDVLITETGCEILSSLSKKLKDNTI